MLAPDNELFVLGNAERELLAKQANCQVEALESGSKLACQLSEYSKTQPHMQVSHEEQEEVMASLKAEMAEKSTG